MERPVFDALSSAVHNSGSVGLMTGTLRISPANMIRLVNEVRQDNEPVRRPMTLYGVPLEIGYAMPDDLIAFQSISGTIHVKIAEAAEAA